MTNNLKKLITFFVGICVSGICLFLAFKNVPFNELLNYISKLNYIYITFSILLVMSGFFLRAIRWQILMKNKIEFSPCFHVLMTGFMLNCIMPARAGEIARPVLINRLGKIGFSEAISSVAVERLFDIMVLLSLFILLYPQIKIPDTLSYNFGNYRLDKELLEGFVSGVSKLFMVLLSGIALIAMEKTRYFLLKINIKPLKSFINGFASGISAIKNSLTLLKVILLSFAIWIVQAVSYFVVLKAVDGITIGVDGIGIGFVEITFVMVVICFFIAIPSVPGFWGVWEAGGIFAMMIFGISKTDAAGYNLINHGVQMFPVILTGFCSAWLIGLSNHLSFLKPKS